MREIQNNLILVLTVLAFLSIIFSFWFHFQQTDQITGLVIGTVNVTVNRTAALSLIRDNINFTVTTAGDPRTSYTAGDLTGAPLANCGQRLNTATCGFNLTNDGSVTINITLQETGTLFSSATFNRVRHFLYNISVPSTARTRCGSFYTLYQPQIGSGVNTSTGINYGVPAGNWTPVNTTAVTVICGLNFTNPVGATNLGSDVAAIDINITVPSDETSGTKGTTLDIVAIVGGYD